MDDATKDLLAISRWLIERKRSDEADQLIDVFGSLITLQKTIKAEQRSSASAAPHAVTPPQPDSQSVLTNELAGGKYHVMVRMPGAPSLHVERWDTREQAESAVRNWKARGYPSAWWDGPR